MKIKLIIVCFIGLICTSVLLAFKVESMKKAGEYASLVKNLENSKDLTIGVMSAMPLDKYSYQPTTGVRTFAEQAAHIAYAAEGYSEMLIGKQPKWKLGDGTKLSKTELIELTKKHFDTLKSIAQNGPKNDGLLSGLASFFDHNAHHRGQMIIYLRMNGINPPEYK